MDTYIMFLVGTTITVKLFSPPTIIDECTAIPIKFYKIFMDFDK